MAVMGAVAWRVVSEGRRELAAGEAAFASGDLASATVRARRAAGAYVPLAEHVPRAYERLRVIATEAERRGDIEAALFAWRAVRSAAIGSRWLVFPHARERREADAAIARLSAAFRDAGGGPGRATAAQSGRRLAAALAVDEGPSRMGSLLVLGGLACIVGGGIWLTRRWPVGHGSETASHGRRIVGAPAVLVVAGFVGWLVGWLLG
jgi:hypothetical protein